MAKNKAFTPLLYLASIVFLLYSAIQDGHPEFLEVFPIQ